MAQRFMTIWFRYLPTDWWNNRQPGLKAVPFVLTNRDHGRIVVAALNREAMNRRIYAGISLADARAILPELRVEEYQQDLPERLLKKFAEWCLRYTPCVAVDGNDGLILDISGCAHLWGGERPYLKEIIEKIRAMGYDARGAIASTIGTAWAVSRFGTITPIIEPRNEKQAIASLSSASLRLEPDTLDKLFKLGLASVGMFMNMERSALLRRFGYHLLLRLDQALGFQQEIITPEFPPEPFQERLPCIEPVRARKAIEIAIQRLLEMLCKRLQSNGKGLRKAILTGHRVDGKQVQAVINTSRASNHVAHLYKLFELEITTIEPDLGIELFILDAPVVEDVGPVQEVIWNTTAGKLEDAQIGELLDRIAGKVGGDAIHRYLPDQHHWPERSVSVTQSLQQKAVFPWPEEKLRPVFLLKDPELIIVMAPVPDYPPINFRYRGKVHKIAKADGPERIEREWWQDKGPHRDYYSVEDTEGKRYWVFRLGHYNEEKQPDWYIHGFFA